MAMMSAFSLGVESGLPPESLVLEMYMSEEMEMVFRSFREQGFFNASSVHGPTALFGGYLRTMELMGSNLTDIFQRTFEEIRNGEFERKFEAERRAGYPELKLAGELSKDDNPQGLAERRRRAWRAGPQSPS
jgi:ketol-acid reductoisomerase